MTQKNITNQSYADWQASVIERKITRFISWLNSRNARVIGDFEGQINLALDNDDFQGLIKDLFKEEQSESSEKKTEG